MSGANRLSTTVAVLCLASPCALASPRAPIEIGMPFLGMTVISTDLVQNGETVTQFGAPAPGTNFLPSLYAAFFVGSSLSLEPYVSGYAASGGGTSVHFLNAAARVAYFPRGHLRKSMFLFASGALSIRGGDGDSKTQPGVGGGIGYRIPFGGYGALRLETNAHQYFDPAMTLFSVNVAIALVFK
jgi:hypothetical protein